MRKINNAIEEVYKFIGGDLNPTAIKIDRYGYRTNEIYNKDVIINTLEDAIKNDENIVVFKENLTSTGQKKYTFNFTNDKVNNPQLITVMVDDPNFYNRSTTSIPVNININQSDDRYIARLDGLKATTIKVNRRRIREDIILKVATCAMVGSIVAASFLAGVKSDQLTSENLKKQRDELNKQRSYNYLSEVSGPEDYSNQELDDNIKQEINQFIEGVRKL